ncbi:MAG TPA: peptidoglycan-associated lipoprotein Pal [Rhodanobacteraceae bacterium]|jgi:peptidoglycan-associated lipoprotein|nr:peptidoglycan-associated lipoprotein Pal [Rhodanobacteraceae bacterium]
MNATVRVSIVALFCLAAAACAKKQEVKPATVEPTPAPVVAQTSGAFTPADLQTNECLRTRVIYFDFDKSEIKSDFDAVIACHAKYLRDRPMARMTLEGNTDERGTREYNLGLGERRGNAVASALEAAGASADQIKVVSYGEERPVCREHNEACWHQNRRVNISYTVE